MLYFQITKNDSVKNINVRECECSFAFEEIILKYLFDTKQYALLK